MVAGAAGSAGGGLMNLKRGPRNTLLMADILFFLGSILNSLRHVPVFRLIGCIIISVATGLSFMTGPLFIKNSVCERLNGGLVLITGFMLTMGPTFQYYMKLYFDKQVCFICVT